MKIILVSILLVIFSSSVNAINFWHSSTTRAEQGVCKATFIFDSGLSDVSNVEFSVRADNSDGKTVLLETLHINLNFQNSLLKHSYANIENMKICDDKLKIIVVKAIAKIGNEEVDLISSGMLNSNNLKHFKIELDENKNQKEMRIINNKCTFSNIICSFHKSGSLYTISEVENNIKNGIEFIFDANQTKITKQSYKDGLVDGKVINYFSNGEVESIVSWKEGQILGLSKWYSQYSHFEKQIYFTPLYAIEIVNFSSQYSCEVASAYGVNSIKESNYNSSCKFSFDYPVFYSRVNKLSEFKSTEISRKLNQQYYDVVAKILNLNELVIQNDGYNEFFSQMNDIFNNESNKFWHHNQFKIIISIHEQTPIFSWSHSQYFGGNYDSSNSGVLVLSEISNSFLSLVEIVTSNKALVLSALQKKYNNVHTLSENYSPAIKKEIINKIQSMSITDINPESLSYRISDDGKIYVSYGNCSFTVCSAGFMPNITIGHLSELLK